MLYTQHSEKQHGITRQCYLQLNTTDNDKTTRILTKLQHKYTCLPERPYTALYSWWWVELSPETCRVEPLRRINAIVASCWNYFTIKHDARNHKYYVFFVNDALLVCIRYTAPTERTAVNWDGCPRCGLDLNKVQLSLYMPWRHTGG